MERVVINKNNPSIMRIEKLCINCGQCRKTCEETTGIINNKEYKCLNCGACINSCPVGALRVKYDYEKVLNYIKDTDYKVVALISPAIRVALGEEFGLNKGEFVEKEVINCLKKIGFFDVVDTAFAADVTIMEEANELLERIKNNDKLPMFTSCCPSFVKYLNYFYPQYLENISTTKSPVLIEGTLVKTYYADLKEFDPNKIIVVAITPCTSKKYEITQNDTVDFVLTTTELAILIKQLDIKFEKVNDSLNLISSYSEGGLKFGISGGVTFSILKYLENIKILKQKPNYENILGENFIKEETININNKDYKIAVVNGIKNLNKIMPKLKEYIFIEVMNCYGGCISGGGQPLTTAKDRIETIKKRRKSIKNIRNYVGVKACNDNLEIIDLYNSYLSNYVNKKKLHK